MSDLQQLATDLAMQARASMNLDAIYILVVRRSDNETAGALSGDLPVDQIIACAVSSLGRMRDESIAAEIEAARAAAAGRQSVS